MQHAPNALNHQLPPPQAREPIHTRRLTFNSFAREDGLWDIEAELIDDRHYVHVAHEGNTVEPGQHIHHMLVRLTVDRDLIVREVATAMANAPFGECQGATPPLQRLVGARIGAGWRRVINEAMGGIRGCSHLRELAINMATAALQAVPHHVRHREGAGPETAGADGEPMFFMGQCLSWDFDGPLVQRVAPQFAGWRPLKKT